MFVSFSFGKRYVIWEHLLFSGTTFSLGFQLCCRYQTCFVRFVGARHKHHYYLSLENVCVKWGWPLLLMPLSAYLITLLLLDVLGISKEGRQIRPRASKRDLCLLRTVIPSRNYRSFCQRLGEISNFCRLLLSLGVQLLFKGGGCGSGPTETLRIRNASMPKQFPIRIQFPDKTNPMPIDELENRFENT